MYWYQYVYYPTYNRLDGLLVGVGIAALYQFAPAAWARIAQYPRLMLALSLAVLTGAYFLCETPRSYATSVFGFPLVAAGYGLMLISAISPGSFLYRRSSSITAWIATLSYAIYLSHKGVIHVTHQFLKDAKLEDHLLLIVSIVTCAVAAYVLHRAVEKPFMWWRGKVLKG